MERRFRIFRYIIYSTELLVLFVIQGIPNFIPELFGGKPSLVIPVVLTISMFEPKLTALWFGLEQRRSYRLFCDNYDGVLLFYKLSYKRTYSHKAIRCNGDFVYSGSNGIITAFPIFLCYVWIWQQRIFFRKPLYFKNTLYNSTYSNSLLCQ